jgi:hypothetical protein
VRLAAGQLVASAGCGGDHLAAEGRSSYVVGVVKTESRLETNAPAAGLLVLRVTTYDLFMANPELLAALSAYPWWSPAVATLKQRAQVNQSVVNQRVARITSAYHGLRAAMCVDVVLSRQRDYDLFVVPTVQTWIQQNPTATLANLAANGPGPVPRLQKHSRADEAKTIVDLATGLERFCVQHGLNEDDGVHRWANETEPLRFTPLLEPYVGCTRGIGVALFNYVRLLAGADALKPDGRVESKIRGIGVPIPEAAPVTLLTVCESLAEELEVNRVWLDQLLWYL